MPMTSAVRHEVARVERGASLQASVQRLSPLPLCVTGNGGVESEGERLRAHPGITSCFRVRQYLEV